MSPGLRHAECVQFLIQLQAERPEVRWQDKLSAARKADEAKRRRSRPKAAANIPPRSMLLAEQRSRAARAELAKTPVVQPSLAGTDVWIVMRQWKALVEFQKQLRRSGPGKRAASNRKEPKLTESLERTLESELVKVDGAADASKSAIGVASINSWTESVATPLSPEGVASVSASRTESHAVLERFRKSTNVRRALSGRKSTLGTADSGAYRLLRSCWRAWCDHRCAASMQQLALGTSPGARITEGVVSPRKAPVAISHALGTPRSVEARTRTVRQEESTDCDLAAEDWDLAAENLRRNGRRRAPDFKVKKSALFLMHRARLRTNSGAEAKLFAKQTGGRSD